MANQQLIDYIQEQLKKGVSPDTLRKVLSAAGWMESDINEGMDIVQGKSPAAVQAAAPVSTAVASSTTAVSDITPHAEAVSAQPAASTTGSPSPSAAESFATSPAAASMNPAATPIEQSLIPKTSSPLGGKHITPMIAMWGVIVLLILIAGYSFTRTSGLRSEASALSDQNVELTTQHENLSNDKRQLESQVQSLSSKVADMEMQLAAFATPESGATTNLPVRVKGTLAQAGTTYTLTTEQRVMFFVGNSREADATLKPLIGGAVELSGVHALASRTITVREVNGTALQTPATPVLTTPNPGGAATSSGQTAQ